MRRSELAAMGLGLLLALSGLFVAVSLLTWDVRDPQVLGNYEAPPRVFRNKCGAGGAYAASFLFRAHGVAAFAVPAALLGLSAFLFSRRSTRTCLRRAGGAGVVILALSMLAGTARDGWLASAMAERSVEGPGGTWGACPVAMLARLAGGAGTYLVILFAVAAGAVLVWPRGVERGLGALGRFSLGALPFAAHVLGRAFAAAARRARPRTTEDALRSLTGGAEPQPRPSALLPIEELENLPPITDAQLRTTRIVAVPATALGEAVRRVPKAKRDEPPAPGAVVREPEPAAAEADLGEGEKQSDLGRMLLGEGARPGPEAAKPPEAAQVAEAGAKRVSARRSAAAAGLRRVARPGSPKSEGASTPQAGEPSQKAPERVTTRMRVRPPTGRANAPHVADAAPASQGAQPKSAPSPGPAPGPVPEPEERVRPLRLVAKGDYALPPADILLPEEPRKDVDRKELAERGYQVVRTLAEFDIEAELAGYESGPSVTLYEIQLGPGINVSRVHALVNNIAMAVMSQSVRVVGPIPGRSTIGVEIPNHRMEVVRMRPLVESKGRAAAEMAIPLVLGRDASGRPLFADLGAMPHLLIAGATGSGKSVCMNSIIASVLMMRRPDQVRLLLIDPKMVEFLRYGDVPHLVAPVMTEVRRAVGCLEWAVREMQARYEMLMTVRARDIKSYNNIVEDERVRRAEDAGREDAERFIPDMPAIVVLVDEFADLMDQVPREMDEYIGRLAQKSRAVGIHLVLATQRPSVNVIMGSIKANFVARIAFQVPTGVDSNCILGRRGAEKLLGFGDMLFLPPGRSHLVRAKGVLISEEEIDRMLDHVAAQPELEDFMALDDRPTAPEREDAFAIAGERGGGGADELYEDAVRVVLSAQRAAVSLLRRRLDIGYPRAGRLIDMMEKNGVIGPFKGSQSRDINMTLDEWEKARRLRKSA